jgi:hypothetical protein
MAEELPDIADVGAVFKKICGKAVADPANAVDLLIIVSLAG